MASKKKDTRYMLSVMYRDADNWKDFYEVMVNPKEYPDVLKLKAGDKITMGQFETECPEVFFGGENHVHNYDPDYDHNILEVVEVYLYANK